ncbi:MAG TPA: DUF3830 family protein [Steroidobacteraceae bacterium]|jgi:hypothetical protein|nr:DUF3830 family protein [Steroidobacteraceae bacterium]
MTNVRIAVGPHSLRAKLETALAPATCEYFRKLLPYESRIIHARWSGEACWIPLGDRALEFPVENATSYPAPGQLILYPGGFSEAELLLAYGAVRFASKLGQLAGNHFMTITEGLEALPLIGRLVLWQGAQDISVDLS